jgi:hypothetical protein
VIANIGISAARRNPDDAGTGSQQSLARKLLFSVIGM